MWGRGFAARSRGCGALAAVRFGDASSPGEARGEGAAATDGGEGVAATDGGEGAAATDGGEGAAATDGDEGVAATDGDEGASPTAIVVLALRASRDRQSGCFLEGVQKGGFGR